MTKELYQELKEIEDRLYDICTEIDSEGEKLYDVWLALYSYLEKVEDNAYEYT